MTAPPGPRRPGADPVAVAVVLGLAALGLLCGVDEWVIAAAMIVAVLWLW